VDQAEGLRQHLGTSVTGPPLRVIAVTSGKGGVGKTNISANLALIAAKAGKRVLIIDADLGLANVEILFGLMPRYNIGHLIDGTVGLEQVLAHGPHGICMLPAGSGTDTLTRLDPAQKLRLVTALDQLEDRFDLVLVDTGAGIGENVQFFVGATQEVLLVVNQEPTALSDAYAAIKVFSQKAAVRQFNVVVNSVPNEPLARGIFDKLTKVADRFLDVHVRYVGFIPRDENVHRSVMARAPITLEFPHSPASTSLRIVAERLLSEAPPPQLHGGLKLLWQRMFNDFNAATA
jgi:flagellar biosynthesis protein FlhG